MPRRQRIAFLAIAAVIAVAAVAVALAGGADDGEEPERAAPRKAETSPAGKPRPKPPLLTANSGKTVRAKKGEVARFRARSKSAEALHVHGYDILRPLPANRTITVRFPAKLEGVYEIELERSHTPLGELEVTP